MQRDDVALRSDEHSSFQSISGDDEDEEEEEKGRSLDEIECGNFTLLDSICDEKNDTLDQTLSLHGASAFSPSPSPSETDCSEAVNHSSPSQPTMSVDMNDLLFIPTEEIELDCVVGSGQYGDVYRAKLYGEDVAVKVINGGATSLDEFLLEFKVLVTQAARCSSVVRILGYTVTGVAQSPAIVMQLYETTLLEHIKSVLMATKAPLEPVDAVSICVDICQALVSLHRHKLVHADMKPENIFIERREGRLRAIVGDFGLCTGQNNEPDQVPQEQNPKPQSLPKNESGQDLDTATELGSDIVGTLRYAAPEATHGRVTPASDMWSWGGIAAFCLTGIPPWFYVARTSLPTTQRNDRILEAMRRQYPPVALPPWVPPDLATTIDRCLSYNAMDRPEAKATLEMLKRLLTALREDNERSSSKTNHQHPSTLPQTAVSTKEM